MTLKADAAGEASRPQTMFFRSLQVDAHWDTWMYDHEGTFYLFYLITEYSPGEGFGVATSADGVTWTDHGCALQASEKMEIYLGTGAVWKAADFATSGRFVCNYSEHWREDGEPPQQCIFFAWSVDLIHWTKYGDDPMFRVNERFYRKPGRWDCIFAIPAAGGGYYGYWTANPLDHVGFGFGRSDDGIHWEALHPPVLDWGGEAVPEHMEAGAVERIRRQVLRHDGPTRAHYPYHDLRTRRRAIQGRSEELPASGELGEPPAHLFRQVFPHPR